MKLKITERTKWNEICEIISTEHIKLLQEKIIGEYPFDFYSIKISEFSELLNGNFSIELKKILTNEKVTVFAFIQIKNSVEKFLADFSKILKSYEIKQSNEEKRASANLPESDLIESMLIFMQRFFGLKSFVEAEKMTIADFIIAKKADYTSKLYEKNLSDEFNRKSRIRS